MSLKILPALFGAAILPSILPAIAETTTEETVVIAHRFDASVTRLPRTVIVIDRNRIERSAATSLDQLLRQTAALDISDSVGNGVTATVGLRGVNGNTNVLILVDGRRLNNADLSSPDLLSIATGDIERVEILPGSAGALYGDNAVGGVINVITRKPDVFRASLHAKGGSYGLSNYRGSISDRFDGGMDYRFSFEKRQSDGYRDNTRLSYDNYLLNLGWNYRGGRIIAEMQKILNDHLLPASLSAAEVDINRKQASGYLDIRTDTNVRRLGIEQNLSDEWSLMAELTERDFESDNPGFSVTFGNSNVLIDRRVRTFSPRIRGSAGAADIVVGIDIEKIDFASVISSDAFGVDNSRFERRTQSVYAQIAVPLAAAVQLTVAGRHQKMDSDVVATSSNVFSTPVDTTISDSENALQIGVVWQVTDDWKLYLNRDENFRFALPDEQVSVFSGTRILDTQQGVSWELGARLQQKLWHMDMSVFELDLENEIGFDPLEGFFGENTNFDDTRRRGLHVAGEWQPLTGVEVQAQYQYMDSEFDAGRHQGNKVPQAPRQTATLLVGWQPLADLSLQAEARYNGERYVEFANTAGKEGGHTLFNVAAVYHWKNWQAAVRVDNLTGKQYNEFVSYSDFLARKAFFPSPERRFTLELGYIF